MTTNYYSYNSCIEIDFLFWCFFLLFSIQILSAN
uniref:Uncharacterized protein n=1 Tax=Anguilla anguilla TaxID=7936 RepID=A0A0E9RTJ4_ANGAN